MLPHTIIRLVFPALILAAVQPGWGADMYQPCRIGLIIASTPTLQFQDNQDGTVTDLKTKLVWKKCIEGLRWEPVTHTCSDDPNSRDMYNWQEALALAQATNATGGFANAADWRLPNIKELSSIIENACYGPSINLEIFPNTPAGIYWSSTPYIGADEYAWSVRFNYGQNSMNLKYDYYFARLVRNAN